MSLLALTFWPRRRPYKTLGDVSGYTRKEAILVITHHQIDNYTVTFALMVGTSCIGWCGGLAGKFPVDRISTWAAVLRTPYSVKA